MPRNGVDQDVPDAHVPMEDASLLPCGVMRWGNTVRTGVPRAMRKKFRPRTSERAQEDMVQLPEMSKLRETQTDLSEDYPVVNAGNRLSSPL